MENAKGSSKRQRNSWRESSDKSKNSGIRACVLDKIGNWEHFRLANLSNWCFVFVLEKCNNDKQRVEPIDDVSSFYSMLAINRGEIWVSKELTNYGITFVGR